jgi:thiol-disulfide isomerase/thioredoxin
MKNIFKKLFVLVLSAVSISGCTKPAKVVVGSILSSNPAVELIDYIDFEEFTGLIAAKTNFLVIYGDSTCSGCVRFQPILEEYSRESSIKFYYIDIQQYSTTEKNKLPNYLPLKGTPNPTPTPTLYLLKKGKVYKSIVNIQTKTALSEFVEKYVASVIKVLSIEEFRNKLAKKDTFVIYVGRPGCGTCAKFINLFFDDYLAKNLSKLDIYSWNTDEIRLDENGKVRDYATDEAYINVRNELKFRWTPTLHRVEKGVIVSTFQFLDNEAGAKHDGKYVADYTGYNDWSDPASLITYDKTLEGVVYDSEDAMNEAFEEHYLKLAKDWFATNAIYK